MPTLVRRNSLDELRDPLALARNLLTWDPFGTSERASGFAARFEVKETDAAFLVIGDLPGVKEEEIDISVDNDVMTISGSRTAEEKKENETYYLYERQYGSFSRSFRLPAHTDSSKIEAHLEHGVLTMSIPKKEASRPRKIALK